MLLGFGGGAMLVTPAPRAARNGRPFRLAPAFSRIICWQLGTVRGKYYSRFPLLASAVMQMLFG